MFSNMKLYRGAALLWSYPDCLLYMSGRDLMEDILFFQAVARPGLTHLRKQNFRIKNIHCLFLTLSVL